MYYSLKALRLSTRTIKGATLLFFVYSFLFSSFTSFTAEAASLPNLPGAGGSFIEPTFGNRIMQLTDKNDGTSCNNAYSYWPSFNVNSTRLHIYCHGTGPVLYTFDPAAFKVITKETLSLKTPAGTKVEWIDSIWSLNPDILFAHDKNSLWRYNVKAKKYAKVADFSKALPAGTTLHQMSKNTGDNRFAFTEVRSGKYAGYFVYDDLMKKIVYRQTSFPHPLDEVQLDKNGSYLMVKYAVPGTVKAADISNSIVNLSTKKIAHMTNGKPDFAPGHSDNGAGTVVGYDRWNNTIVSRAFATPRTQKTILSFGNDWTGDYHISMLGKSDKWAIITSNNGDENGGLQNEIFAVATDGSGKKVRLAKHNAVQNNPNDFDDPHANISRDGKFVVFTSSWGERDRWDVFIIKTSGLS